MPNLYIGEYVDLGATGRGATQFVQEPSIASILVEIGSSSVQSLQFLDETCIARLVADADCAIDIGTDPDATDSIRVLRAGVEQLISVVPGSKMKVAVIATGAAVGSGYDTLGNLLQVVASPAEAKKALDALTAQASKAAAAALDLRTANNETLTLRDEALKAANQAKKERADADAAAAALVDLKAQIDKRSADVGAKADAFEADVTARKAELDKRGADLIDAAKRLDVATKDVLAQEADLAKQQAEVAAKSAAADALVTEYNDKLAKLKALTG